MSQDKLATIVGCSGMTISNWENGKSQPDPDSMRKLEKVLGKYRTDEALGEEGDFGNWLRTERTNLGATQQQLADEAGVNALTISLIELGKINKPQRKTIDRLETALEKRYSELRKGPKPPGRPAQVILPREDEGTARSQGIGSFIEFNPHVDEERPKEPGIYVLYDISERPIYVGQAQEIRSRIRDHRDKFWFKEPIVESAAYIRVDDKELRNRLEEVLIKFMKSNAVLNKQKVDR